MIMSVTMRIIVHLDILRPNNSSVMANVTIKMLDTRRTGAVEHY